MVKSFYYRVMVVIMLFALMVIGVIIIAQYNRTEANQIALLKEAEKARLGAVGANPMAVSVCPDLEPGNLLTADDEPYLPAEYSAGGTLNLLAGSDPKGFNYLIENSVDVSNIEALNMTPMVTRHKKDVTKYAPALATFIGRSDDYLTYTYKLRPDIFWHEPGWLDNEDSEGREWLAKGESCLDVGRRTAAYLKANNPELADADLAEDRHWVNGRCRVTAHDLYFWLKLLMNPQVGKAASMRAYFKDLDMDGVKVLDDFSFQIRWKNKKYKNDLVARSYLSTTPEYLYAYDDDGERFEEEILGTQFEAHWYNPRGIGSGPYRFSNFERGVAVTLERDSWFPLGGNAFDNIVVKIVKDPSQHPRMLVESAEAESGKVNPGVHITSLGSQQYRQVMEGSTSPLFQDGTIKNSFFWRYGYSYIGWNADKPYFSDKRVRRAMSYALKADEILKEIRFGLGKRTTGPITPGLPHYDDTLEPIPYDLDTAKALLTEAGWVDTDNDGILDKEIDGNSIPFEFTFNVIAHPTHQMTAEVLKESLKKLGIKCNLKAMEWANYQKELQSKKFDAVMLGWGTSPNVDFDQIWHSRHADTPKSSNYVAFRSPEADSVIEAMEYEFDMKKRYALAKKFHRIIYEEQPYTFLFQSKTPYFWTEQLVGGEVYGLARPYLSPRRWSLKSEE